MGDDVGWAGWLPESQWVRVGSVLVIGLVASTFHWSGILLGGILVGLVPSTRSRAVVSGAAFGLLVWVVGTASLVAASVLPTVDALQIYGLSMAIPVALGTIGATARELRPWVSMLNSD